MKKKYIKNLFKDKNLYKENPIPERIKIKIFNILKKKIKNKKILDLFACTGNFGLEAISRGAKYVEFIEKNALFIKKIKKKIKKIKKKKKYKIVNMDVFKYIKKINKIKYNIIFIDPPYETKIKKNFINKIKRISKKKNIIIYREKKNINNSFEIKKNKTKIIKKIIFKNNIIYIIKIKK